MFRLAFFAVLLVGTAVPAAAQVDHGVLPTDDPLQRFLQRQQTLGTLEGALLTTLPLSAYEAREMLDSIAVRVDRGEVTLPATDRRLLARYRGEAPGPGVGLARGLLGDAVYADGESLGAVDGDGYSIRAQPLLYLTPGLTRRTERADRPSELTTYRAGRGARLAGRVGPVFFDGKLVETQEVAPRDEWRDFTVPRRAFTKFPDRKAYDYFDATGLVGISTEFFEVRAGRDRANWGFGEGTLELSDYAAPQDHVEIRTQFWRLRYTNRYARRVRPIEMRPDNERLYPRSYTALHQLAIDLPGNVQLEAFEMVVFADDSLGGAREGFEVGYLNPFVFYRAVEGDIGTFDNALLGAGAAWNAAPGYRLYGQVLLDEFRAREFSNDWWANKWGFLVGSHVVDPGIGDTRLRGLSLRAEYTRQRPYLYSHRSESSAYVHFYDPLGHPAGPNSSDVSTWVRYVPTPTLEFGLVASRTVRGRNTETENYGADATLPYTTRVANRGITTLQGIRQVETLVEGWGGVEVLPELTLGAGVRYQALDDALDGLDRSLTGFAQIRWGLPYQSIRY